MSHPELPQHFNDFRGSLAPKVPDARTSQCPDHAIWFQVATGAAVEDTTLLDHAAECGYCAAQLQRTLADFGDESNDSEQQLLEEILQISTSKKAVVKMPAVKRSPATSLSPLQLPRAWHWAIAAGIIATVLVGWKIAYPAWAASQARQFLASVEKERRNSEFRLTGSPWAPVRVMRAGTAEPSSALLEARGWGRRAGDKGTTGLLAARIALASGENRDAAAALQKALKTTGRTPEMLNDLGVALAGESAASPESSSGEQALKAFGDSLRLSPSFTPALFNRALLLEEMNRHADACRTLERFLIAETNQSWRSDLQERVRCDR